jgi:flagellar basal body rod protein FlgF
MQLVCARACRMEAAEHGMARLTVQLDSGHTEQQAHKREVRVHTAANAVSHVKHTMQMHCMRPTGATCVYHTCPQE